MQKRIISIILSLTMLLSLMPTTVYAADIMRLMNAAPLQPIRNELYGERVDEILAECGYGQADTYTVFKNCYDWLINNVRYRTADDPYDLMSMTFSFTMDQVYINAQAHGPFYQGVGVCDEYAGALYILAQAIGLKPYYCTGQTRKSGGGYTGHAWMGIELNEQLYMFDAQVEDNVAKGGAIQYYYFGKTLDELSGSHILDKEDFSAFKKANGYFYIEGEEPVYQAGIPVYINEYPMDTYAVEGVLYVVANDLEKYGFRTEWNAAAKTLNISNGGITVKNGGCYHPYVSQWTEVGTAKNSPNEVFLNSMQFPSFAMGDKMLISVGFLEVFGEMSNSEGMTEIYLECESVPAASTEIRVTVDGEQIIFDQPPVVVEGRTLVPLRAIFEAMGASVNWDSSMKTVTSAKDDITVTLQIDNTNMYKNGIVTKLDVPAMVINGRTMVPTRAVAEAFGCDVTWNSQERIVEIN